MRFSIPNLPLTTTTFSFLFIDWKRWSLKGHKGFKLTEKDIANGITAQQFTKNFRQINGSWYCEFVAQDKSRRLIPMPGAPLSAAIEIHEEEEEEEEANSLPTVPPSSTDSQDVEMAPPEKSQCTPVVSSIAIPSQVPKAPQPPKTPVRNTPIRPTQSAPRPATTTFVEEVFSTFTESCRSLSKEIRSLREEVAALREENVSMKEENARERESVRMHPYAFHPPSHSQSHSPANFASGPDVFGSYPLSAPAYPTTSPPALAYPSLPTTAPSGSPATAMEVDMDVKPLHLPTPTPTPSVAAAVLPSAPQAKTAAIAAPTIAPPTTKTTAPAAPVILPFIASQPPPPATQSKPMPAQVDSRPQMPPSGTSLGAAMSMDEVDFIPGLLSGLPQTGPIRSQRKMKKFGRG